MGAAFYAEEAEPTTMAKLIDTLENGNQAQLNPSKTLTPLFKDENELAQFRQRHAKAQASEKNFLNITVLHFLGIDAGSTTTKVVLINEDGDILFSFYGNNEGQPLETTMAVLKDLYEQLPEDVYIGKAAATGYGEALIKNALKVDIGEVETMAHYKAANFFQPGVDFIFRYRRTRHESYDYQRRCVIFDSAK